MKKSLTLVLALLSACVITSPIFAGPLGGLGKSLLGSDEAKPATGTLPADVPRGEKTAVSGGEREPRGEVSGGKNSGHNIPATTLTTLCSHNQRLTMPVVERLHNIVMVFIIPTSFYPHFFSPFLIFCIYYSTLLGYCQGVN